LELDIEDVCILGVLAWLLLPDFQGVCRFTLAMVRSR
jgi:hypothetical protein